MKSPVVKRSIVVAGHKTSVSLEEAFWNGMKEISGLRNMTLSELVGEIDGNRQQGNLSSAIRLFVLDYFKSRAMAASSRSRRSRPSKPSRAPFPDGASRLLHFKITLRCSFSRPARLTSLPCVENTGHDRHQ